MADIRPFPRPAEQPGIEGQESEPTPEEVLDSKQIEGEARGVGHSVVDDGTKKPEKEGLRTQQKAKADEESSEPSEGNIYPKESKGLAWLDGIIGDHKHVAANAHNVTEQLGSAMGEQQEKERKDKPA